MDFNDSHAYANRPAMMVLASRGEGAWPMLAASQTDAILEPHSATTCNA